MELSLASPLYSSWSWVLEFSEADFQSSLISYDLWEQS